MLTSNPISTQTTALITGASRGLGLSLARELAQDGANVILTARTAEAAIGASMALRRQGFSNVCSATLDVSDAQSIAAFAHGSGHQIDVLINNAAVCPTGWSCDATSSCWRTNVLGPLALTHALLPHMLRRGRGHIVHVSSGDGELLYLNTALQADLRAATTERAVMRSLARAAPPRGAYGEAPAYGPTPAYAVSKAALNALTRITAARLAPDCGVRVSAVCPGDVLTRMLSDHEPEARRRGIPPAAAARDVVRLAVNGLGADALPLESGRFWRHGRQIQW